MSAKKKKDTFINFLVPTFPRTDKLKKIFCFFLCAVVIFGFTTFKYLYVSSTIVGSGKLSSINHFTKHRNRPAQETCGNSTRKLTFHKIGRCYSGNQLRYNRNTTKCDVIASHFPCTHFMKTRYTGRAGNQMFQVATLLGTAYYHGYTPAISPSMTIAKWFNLPNLARMKFDNTLLFQERKYCTYDERITVLSHLYNYSFEEYFQSWRYFSGAEEIIRRAFRFKEPILQVAREFLRPFASRHIKTVGVHIRRGDFLSPSRQWYGFNVAPIQYIRKAMEYFTRKYKRVEFIVFSNDKLWCRVNLRWRHVTISPFKLAEQDLAVMTLCDDAIITSGTFGWWGAWLSGGDVIYWNGYPRKGSPLYQHFNHTDYYPSHWIGMD